MTITTRVFAARPSGTSASNFLATATRTLALAMLVLAAFALSACGPKIDWRQKLTVTVETPDGLKSGASVQQITSAESGDGLFGSLYPPEARGVTTKLVQGEAVAVDLGGGKHLFMLISGVNLITQRVLTLPEPWFPDGVRTIPRFKGVAVVPPKKAPLLVTFDDIKDPASVKRVDPNDLAATFGAGYRLSSITLEITNEPVTEGKVESVLGWLSKYPEPGLCAATGRTTNIPFCRRVTHGNFIER